VTKDGGRWISRCVCGGQVRGIWKFHRRFAWCVPKETTRIPKGPKRHRDAGEKPKC